MVEERDILQNFYFKYCEDRKYPLELREMDGSNLSWTEANISEAVWVSDASSAWVAGTITSLQNSKMAEVQESNGESVQVPLDKNGCTKKTKILPRDMALRDNGVDNMDDLVHLHEAAILDNVDRRLKSSRIYTRTGPLLVAMNPFTWLPLYGSEVMQLYRNGVIDELDPHCFAEAERAFRQLRTSSQSQSLIICGESGAGKTETTKLMLEYLSQRDQEGEKGISEKIMMSNPLMESFGNAKTLRNNNSSRFGKFIRLEFDDTIKVKGARISSYLLEKSRTVRQKRGERNYHIFYQLCRGANEQQRASLSLPIDLTSMHYLNQSGCEFVDGIDDVADFQTTLAAMGAVNLDEEQKATILKLVAAVLHIGNIQFGKQDSIVSVVESKDDIESNCPVDTVCELLECDREDFAHALTVKYIHAGGKRIETPLDSKKSADLRDALAKKIFEKVFRYIVKQINKSFETKDSNKFIGILDIYGFESFQKNGFEQLLINYANERLQNLFNEQVFQSEEKVYKFEQVSFNRTDVPENEKCLSLMHGIFKLMHDECLKMDAGSNQGLVNQMNAAFKSHDNFVVCGPGSKRQKTNANDFAICHYAGEIVYSCEDFVDKNKDTLYPHMQDAVSNSKSTMIADMLRDHSAANSSSKLQNTVAKTFSSQVIELSETIRKTGPAFVRCIKTNNELKPNLVDRNSVLMQLKNAGVVAALEMRRAGFPNRILYKDFCMRFRALLPDPLIGDFKSLAKYIVARHLPQIGTDMAMGNTRIFLRANILHVLDSVVQKVVRKHIVLVQCHVRMFRMKKMYQARKSAAILVQKHFRGAQDRKMLGEEIKAMKQRHEWTSREMAFNKLKGEFEILCQKAVEPQWSEFMKAREEVADHMIPEIPPLLTARDDLTRVDAYLNNLGRSIAKLAQTLQKITKEFKEKTERQAKFQSGLRDFQDRFQSFRVQELSFDVNALEGFKVGYLQSRGRLDHLVSLITQDSFELLDQLNESLEQVQALFMSAQDLQHAFEEQVVEEKNHFNLMKIECDRIAVEHSSTLADLYEAKLLYQDALHSVEKFDISKYFEVEALQTAIDSLQGQIADLETFLFSADILLAEHRIKLKSAKVLEKQLVDEIHLVFRLNDVVEEEDYKVLETEYHKHLADVRLPATLVNIKTISELNQAIAVYGSYLNADCDNSQQLQSRFDQIFEYREARKRNIDRLNSAMARYEKVKTSMIENGLTTKPGIQETIKCVQTSYQEGIDGESVESALEVIEAAIELISEKVEMKKSNDKVAEQTRKQLLLCLHRLGQMKSYSSANRNFRETLRAAEQYARQGSRKLALVDLLYSEDINQVIKIVKRAEMLTLEAENQLVQLEIQQEEQTNQVAKHMTACKGIKQRLKRIETMALVYPNLSLEKANLACLRYQYVTRKMNGESVDDQVVREEEDAIYYRLLSLAKYLVPQCDTIDIVYFASTNRVALLKFTQMEAIEALTALETQIEMQTSCMEETNIRSQIRKKEIHLSKMAVQDERAASMVHLNSARERAVRDLVGVRRVVSTLGHLYIYQSESSLMPSLIRTQNSLDAVELALTGTDACGIERQIDVVLQSSKLLEADLFEHTGVSNEKVPRLFIESLCTQDLSIECAVIRNAISKESLFQQWDVQSARFRSICAELQVYEMQGYKQRQAVDSWSIHSLLDEANASLQCAHKRLVAHENTHNISFALVQCLDDDDLIDSALDLKGSFKKLQVSMKLMLSNVSRLEVAFRRCVRKVYGNDDLLRTKVIRFVCP